MSNLQGIEPAQVWKNFESLTDIPRPSKKEQKAAQFVKEFGEKLGLETIMDETGNVIIKKPATPGYEDRQGVILQGHIDMVPQKNNDVDHDFEKDPIEAYVDGEWVTAKGTTLGADNGIGVAAAMTVLESDEIEHGPLEALITIDEESGMTGAFGLKSGVLDGKILVNMDSEDEGELYIGCAGGMDTIATMQYKEEDVPANMKAYKLFVKGLKGGHSGLDIHLGRGNAIKMLDRFMFKAQNAHGLRLGEMEAGNIRNAIPREGEAIVVVPENNAAEFEKFVKDFESVVKNELSSVEPDLKFFAETCDAPSKIMNADQQDALLKGIFGCPNGVMSYIAEMPEVVETSTSMGIAVVKDGKAQITTLQRSSVDSRKEGLGDMIRSVFELAGANVEHKGAYPGWKPDVNSPILATMKEVYNERFNKTPEVKVIHAGLECGIIKDVYPDLDAISFGPTISYPHSPDEKINIETTQKFWQFLVDTLKKVPKK
ncbi:MAG: aminoacyl-histidine dipeptidase [Bacteroidales bacterium]|nr:aminoacyl-histidine dipeptidase [Bacteroidales bacterium]